MPPFPILIASVVVPAFLSSPVVAQVQQASAREARQADTQIQLQLGKVRPLAAILRIAEERRIPLGIAFGPQPILCSEERPTGIHASNLLDALSQAAAGTGYTAIRDGNSYVLLAPDLTPHEKEVLNYRFARFSATESTMNDAGQLLTGYINMTIEGAKGFATASRVGPPSATFTIRLQASTTTQIANRIVSQDGKGVWVLHPPSKPAPTMIRSRVRIYAYDEDASELEHLTCDTDESGQK